jgi:hypothetical protein
VDEMGRACSTNGAKRNAYKVLVGKPGGKRCRWEDIIKTEILGCCGMDVIDLA